MTAKVHLLFPAISLFLSLSLYLYLSYHNWLEIFLWGSMGINARCIFSDLRHELSKYVGNFVPSTKLLSLINRCLILSFFPISIFSFHLYLTASKNTISFYQYFRYYCQLCQYLVEEGEFEVWLVNVILLHGYNVKVFCFNFSVLTQLYVYLLLAYMAMLQNT